MKFAIAITLCLGCWRISVDTLGGGQVQGEEIGGLLFCPECAERMKRNAAESSQWVMR